MKFDVLSLTCKHNVGFEAIAKVKGGEMRDQEGGQAAGEATAEVEEEKWPQSPN